MALLLLLSLSSAVTITFPDDAKDLLALVQPTKSSDETDLVQLEKANRADYPGCGLGHFWCATLQDAGISSEHASRLTIMPSHDNTYQEWYYDGRPTCLATGPHYHKCVPGDQGLLVCAGGSEYGSGPIQATFLQAVVANGGVHPDCSTCTIGRSIAHSQTTCIIKKGETCDYACDPGYVANGTRTCESNGVLVGGGCIVPAVDTETHEMMTPSPIPSPSPSPSPSFVVVTQIDVVHENWTEYQQRLDDEETAHYQALLTEHACLYLLDLENYFQETGMSPRKPVRHGLYDAARAGECAWVHEEVFSTNEEIKHPNPTRGDHGPWPEILTPNIVHIRSNQGVFALHVDLSNNNGRELYKALAKRLSIMPEDITIYTRDNIHPIDDNRPLSSYGLKYSDMLNAVVGPRTYASTQQILWHPTAVSDGDGGVISPE